MFNRTASFSVTVTMEDIAASTVTGGDFINNSYVNSLAKCLQRLDQERKLPGQQAGENPSNGLFYAATQARLMNQAGLVNVCEAFVVDTAYATDQFTANTIAAENVTGQKPSAPYTVQLTRE